MPSVAKLDLFVSHSSDDAALVELLVDLLQSALDLEPDRIRASSVDGYRLPAGIAFEEALRRETQDARAFVGVISPASLKSAYVAFELGSRWGARRHLVPLLTRDVPPDALKGPLASLNAMALSERAQLLQLVDDLAAELGVRARAPHQYAHKLERLLEAAARRPAPTSGPRAASAGVDYADLVERCDVLLALEEEAGGSPPPSSQSELVALDAAERALADWIRTHRLVAQVEIAADAERLLGMLREQRRARQQGMTVGSSESPREVFARLVERVRGEQRRP